MDDNQELAALIEALLLVSDRPLTLKELKQFLGDRSGEKVKDALSTLTHRHATDGGGLQVESIAGGYRISTRSDLGESVKEFFRFKNRQKLSRAALETLAIIAYRQPVTTPEIQEIRGVASDGVLRTLLERRLVRIAGRKDTVGKPMLYGTTRGFLEHFGLGGLDDLPPVEEFGDILGDGVELSMETLEQMPGGARIAEPYVDGADNGDSPDDGDEQPDTVVPPPARLPEPEVSS